jgi:hypothetical protein
MIMLKIFLVLFVIGWLFLLLIVMGETYAMDNKYPRFTKWWRKNWISTEKDLY